MRSAPPWLPGASVRVIHVLFQLLPRQRWAPVGFQTHDRPELPEHADEGVRNGHLPCSRLRMDKQTPPRDDDPSEMTDFEKNATFEELEQIEQDLPGRDSNPIRQERGDERADK